MRGAHERSLRKTFKGVISHSAIKRADSLDVFPALSTLEAGLEDKSDCPQSQRSRKTQRKRNAGPKRNTDLLAEARILVESIGMLHKGGRGGAVSSSSCLGLGVYRGVTFCKFLSFL